MPGRLQGVIALHAQYLCQNPDCGATVDSQITILRAFNYGRCHCGGELRAIPRPRPTRLQPLLGAM